MTPYSENRFYQALENIFVGAQIEGEGGYVNLLKIKNQYYREILQQLKSEVDKEEVITDTFKEEFFDKLYTFFHKYFNESGSVFFVKTAHWQRVYEQVYTDNKDVVLFWKTHMLYYVKSDVLFENMQLTVDDEETKDSYELFFDVSNLKARQNNEKKELVFTFRETQETSTNVDLVKDNPKKNLYVFQVSYSERGNKTKLDDLAKKSKIPERVLEKAFSTFKKQSEVDFFINKNAQAFLEEQLDLYLHQTLLNEENAFDQKRLDQLKTIKTFAKKIIAFIAQFEDELVRVWNKPKFALNSNYVITLDKLSNEIIEKLAKHENLQEQIKEWQELGMVDENFDFAKRSEKETFLPIDTKFFKDLEIEILSVFENIDEALDGRLIHSENYQALNTLQEKYKETVQCVYIDPPFNTGSDFAYVDRFQDSTWLSLMNDRIELARNLLRDDGSFYLHLDYNADHAGRYLMDHLFGSDLFSNKISWKRGRGVINTTGAKFSRITDHILFYTKSLKNVLFRQIYSEYSESTLKMYKHEDEKGKYRLQELRDYSESSIQNFETQNRIAIDNNGNKFLKQYLSDKKGVKISDIWTDIEGAAYTNDDNLSFQTQKPEKLLQRILQASSNPGTYILDFFTGSATTLATAQKLGRKWLGVEMGDHFSTVALPRMKTVLLGKISGISKELEKEKTLKKGGFFKYYHLEQYEDTLKNMKYQTNSPTTTFDTQKPFEQYVFYADQKFSQVIDYQDTSEEIDLNFERLYSNIDFPETISNLLGLPLKAITETSVILDDHGRDREIRTDYHNMTTEEKLEFVRRLKPLLWWGE